MTVDDVIIRQEQPADEGAVRMVNEAAFGRPDEGDLVDRLRHDGAVLASFVAEEQRRVVGHILFSRTVIDAEDGAILSVALAPMAVLPGSQRRGVGTALIRCGLDWLRARGECSVLVLGHTKYYPRFGFSRERARLLITPFPADAFMALELVDGALDGVLGAVRYPAAFQL